MKIIVCKSDNRANDFISNLIKNQGDELKIIKNSDFALGVKHIRELLLNADVVINMMGVKYLKRWNNSNKEEIYNSRVENIKKLVKSINEMEKPPSLMIMPTLVNIYDNINVHDEFSLNFSNDFLGDMCKNWEKEAFKLTSKTRLCIFRTGLVLSDKIGIYSKIRRLSKFNIGGKTGNGKQSLPFIHINDLLKAYKWSISNVDIKGIYNLVSPDVVTNDEFTSILARFHKRIRLVSYPHFFMRLLFNEAATIFTTGQYVIPQRLLSEGFVFDYPTLKKSLE